MRCELCGKEDATLKADVEGAILNVCDTCSRFGAIKARIETKIETEKIGKLEEVKTIENEQIITNYAQAIKRARERAKLSQKEFAARINERESVIHRLECGEMEPSEQLIKKLERTFGLKLVRK